MGLVREVEAKRMSRGMDWLYAIVGAAVGAGAGGAGGGGTGAVGGMRVESRSLGVEWELAWGGGEKGGFPRSRDGLLHLGKHPLAVVVVLDPNPRRAFCSGESQGAWSVFGKGPGEVRRSGTDLR